VGFEGVYQVPIMYEMFEIMIGEIGEIIQMQKNELEQ
jgi:hypothetical protein